MSIVLPQLLIDNFIAIMADLTEEQAAKLQEGMSVITSILSRSTNRGSSELQTSQLQQQGIVLYHTIPCHTISYHTIPWHSYYGMV